MINTITLKNVASYSKDGCNITDLKKVNFFFGANGSGKTTITRFLHSLTQLTEKQNEKYNDCNQVGYDSTQEIIKVFNSDYVQANFYGRDDLDGVFSLNAKNEDIEKQIKEKEDRINAIDTTIANNKTNKEEFEKELSTIKKDVCDVVFGFRDEFNFASAKEAVIKHKGSKENFYNELKDRNCTNPKSFEELKQTYHTLFVNERERISCDLPITQIEVIDRYAQELNTLLEQVIVGKENVPIKSLIDTLNNRSWVEQGKQYIASSKGLCPFCQQPMTLEFQEHIDNFFDDHYKKSIEQIKECAKQYENAVTTFISSIDTLLKEYDDNYIVLNFKQVVTTLFEQNKATIKSKLATPNEQMAIGSWENIKAETERINAKIKEINTLLDNKDTQVKQYKEDVLNYLANKAHTTITTYEQKKEEKRTKIGQITQQNEQLTAERNTLRSEIEPLRAQTVNTKTAVDNINNLLKSAGFENFYIEEICQENNISKYRILRNKNDEQSAFVSLSEGEKSFIAFLYFYQQCIGYSDTDSALKKIVVIDDPVSSMDSQVLFFVNTLIQNLMVWKYVKTDGKYNNRDFKKEFKDEHIAQVFILTHNVYFFKEIAYERRNFCKDMSYYVASKYNATTQIRYSDKNPIKDDYTLLWDEIKQSMSNANTSNILIANTMRRILDSYIYFVGKKDDIWTVLDDFTNGTDEYYAAYSLIAQINDESHKVLQTSGIYYQRMSEIKPNVLYKAFETIFKHIGEEHYKIMMQK